MKSLPLVTPRVFAFLTVLVTFCGCSSAEHLRLSDDDRVALNKIYEASPWVIRQSRLNLQAREGGVVEVKLEGEAKQKPGAGDGPAWLPVALVPELPEYFQATDLSTSKPIELESYRVPGGLWLVTVIIPDSQSAAPSLSPLPLPASTSPSPNSLQTSASVETPSSNTANPQPQVNTRPMTVNISVLMVSEKYSTGFPFLLATGQGHSSIDASIVLPNGSSFSNLAVFGSDTPASRATSFTQLPASLSGNAVTAAGRLSPETVAWNFSGVTYAPNVLGVWRPWFLPSGILIGLVAVALWWRVEQVESLNKWRSTLRRRRSKAIADLEHEFNEMLTSSKRDEMEMNPDFQRRWANAVSDMAHLIPQHGFEYVSYSKFESWRENSLRPVLEGLDQYRSVDRHPKYPATVYRVRLERFDARVESLHDVNKRLLHAHKAWRIRNIISWFFAGLVTACSIWLLSTFAHAQSPTSSAGTKPVFSRLATLGELGVSIAPQDPYSTDYESVKVGLSFFPLTDHPGSQSMEEISFGIADKSNLSIAPMQLPANSPAKLVQETGKLVRMTVPTSYAPVIQRWKALAEWKPVDFSATPEYFKSLDAATRMNFEYSIKGAQSVSEHRRGKFFHWFPYDTIEVDFPLELRQPAIVSHIDLQPPTLDYVSSPSLEGLNTPFTESDNGTYESVSKEKEGRSAIWASKPVTIKAKFERPLWRRWGLTAGQLIVGLIIGFAIGFVLSAGEKSRKSILIAMFGVLGLPFAIRTAVLAQYEHLPSVIAWQGITLFEAIFLVNIMFMVVVSNWAYKMFERRKNS